MSPPDLDPTRESIAQQAIDAITQRELDPRAIDSYADDALGDLIQVIEDIVGTHVATKLTGVDRERVALSEAGLDPMVVEQTLDHIADVADSIRSYDQLLLRKTQPINKVLLPPNPDRKKEITSGDGSFEKPKELLPKLRTILLVLDKVFGIDIRDNNAVQIVSGVVQPDMMRNVSYSAISIPELKRTIFACDETGNTTFVFDNSEYEQQSIATSDLYELTKDDLRDLIKDSPQFGTQINYSKQYASHLIEALQNPIENSRNTSTAENTHRHILRPNISSAPEGYLSRNGISRKLGVSKQTVKKVAAELSEELGEIKIYRFGSTPGQSYSPEQVEQIRKHLSSLFAIEDAPEGYMSINQMSKKLGVATRTIQITIDRLNDELNEVELYRFGTAHGKGYSPEQVEQIKTCLENLLSSTEAPDGYLSTKGISRELGVVEGTVKKAIAKLSGELGEVKTYKFRGRPAKAYSLDQIEIIRTFLSDVLKVQGAPVGFLAMSTIIKNTQHREKAFKKAVAELGAELGEVKHYRFGQRIVNGYSPEQVEMIRLHLEK